MSVRLTGTEKQRDDALEALVLQQEIAEELERERKRNKKELAALQHTNHTITRQRDDARRVVLHLRSLIGGQSHHLEHLVGSLTKPENDNDLAHEVEGGYEDDTQGKFSKHFASNWGSPRGYVTISASYNIFLHRPNSNCLSFVSGYRYGEQAPQQQALFFLKLL